MQEIITLRQIWRDYEKARTLKPKTHRDYICKFKKIEDWLDLDATTITRKMVKERHRLQRLLRRTTL